METTAVRFSNNTRLWTSMPHCWHGCICHHILRHAVNLTSKIKPGHQ